MSDARTQLSVWSNHGEGGWIRLPHRYSPFVIRGRGDLEVNSPANFPPAQAEPAWRAGRTRRKALRWAVNAWLVYHLAAIIIAPASVSPSSALLQSAWRVFHTYLQLLYLNNGYHFFAPDPSESTLLAFAAQREDGTVIRGRIPDRGIAPRLLYHRHFMLTEQMNSGPDDLGRLWHDSYAQHIGRKYGAKQVTLTRQLHFLPTMEMVRSGVRLDAPASYESDELGVFECAEP
jgi:hypothetical protein